MNASSLDDDNSGKNIEVFVRYVKVPREMRHAAVWKIAYADFVTALMAFFLLLWLLSSSSSETLDGVGNMFEPNPIDSETTAAAGGVYGGEGLQTEQLLQLESNTTPDQTDADRVTPFPYTSDFTGESNEVSTGASGSIEYDVTINRQSELADRLREQIANLPGADQLEETVFFNIAPQGIHLELIFPTGDPMFEIGSAVLTQQTKILLRPLVQLLAKLEEFVSIGGYSDSSGSSSANWALSAKRALVTKQFLVFSGFPESRIEHIAGYSDRRPLLDYDFEAPGNRRLTITLLNKDFTDLQNALTKSSVPPRLLK